MSHDDFETRYWLRTAAGSWVTIMMSAAGFAYALFFAAPQHRLGIAVMTGVIAASGLVTLFVMPWRRIVASRWREGAFLVWGVLSVASIFGLAMIDGGESPLQLALFLPIVFASLSFPLRNLVVLAVWAEVGWAATSSRCCCRTPRCRRRSRWWTACPPPWPSARRTASGSPAPRSRERASTTSIAALTQRSTSASSAAPERAEAERVTL